MTVCEIRLQRFKLPNGHYADTEMNTLPFLSGKGIAYHMNVLPSQM